jgi:hypothetical protein
MKKKRPKPPQLSALSINRRGELVNWIDDKIIGFIEVPGMGTGWKTEPPE